MENMSLWWCYNCGATNTGSQSSSCEVCGNVGKNRGQSTAVEHTPRSQMHTYNINAPTQFVSHTPVQEDDYDLETSDAFIVPKEESPYTFRQFVIDAVHITMTGITIVMALIIFSVFAFLAWVIYMGLSDISWPLN